MNLKELTNEELINQHKWAWVSWKDARKNFGEWGSSPHGQFVGELEEEARRRGITDEALMADIPKGYR